MNKKITILLLISLVILVTALSFFSNKASDNQKTGQAIHQMTRGTIVELKSDTSIVVEGQIGMERKKVEFTITPQTILKNHASIFPKSGIQDGKVFRVETELKLGKQSDFAVNLMINKIESKEDLSNINKATAIEINYSTDEF